MYPLAPKQSIEEGLAFLDALSAHLERQADNERLVYAGDSASGGLALSYAIRQRDNDVGRRAAALILFAPWVDVTMTNPGIPAMEPADIMLVAAGLRTCGKWWAGSRDPADPAVSPIHADLAGLPPVSIFQGDRDLFLPDVTLLDQRIRQTGGDSSLTVAKGGFHVYVGAPWVPEAKYALDRAAAAIAGSRAPR